MFTRITFSLLAILLLNTISNAQWISLDPSSYPGASPGVELLSSDPSGALVKINLPGFWIREFEADGKIYHSIDIGDDGITTEAGFPEIPHIAKVLAIPDKGLVSVEVVEKSGRQIISGKSVPPARESWLEGKPESPYIENSMFYSSANIYPQEIAKVEDPSIFRDFRIARVSVFPIRYTPGTREIEAYSSITVRVKYSAGNGINEKITPLRPIVPSFAKLYRSFIFNYEEILQQRYNGREDGYDIMLCIMPDNLYASFQPYAQWKHKSGTMIIQKKFSEIGASANNPTAVKDCILNYYTNSDTVPSHVLIVGDYGVAPIKRISYDYTFANEDYFVELEGLDFFPEMMIGRFTNQEDYRLQVMVNKFKEYERNPYIEGEDWFVKGIVCSNNAYASQVETKRFAAELMRDTGNFISVDTMMSKNPCIYNLSNVVAAINSGRGILNYRGEGWSTGWWAQCYDFTTSVVNSLNNGKKLTFVTSIGCGVAMFDASGADNCFGEAWVELGTLTEPRGGVAFIGPTSNTHTTYNNKIDKGIYVGMFDEGMDSPGEALLRGKLYLFNVYGNIMWVEYHYRVYCILGDPSLHVWKNIPKPVNVTHPSIIPVGFSQSEILVTSSIGFPVNNARVTITADGVFAFGVTNPQGLLTLELTTALEGNVNITICGDNVIPYEGTIQVVAGSENLAPNGSPVIADLDGNQDGLVNPNENCSIKFELKNWGTVPANNVYAKLTVPDSITYVQMVVDSIIFGTIGPNDSLSTLPFKFYVTPECPVLFTIPFKLYIASTLNTWNFTQNVLVHGCVLQNNAYHIDDAGNILYNFRMDPGETVKISFEIKNTGDDNAPAITGILSSADQYITILDSTGTFGSLLPDSSSVNQADYFEVKVSDNCPLKYNASFNLKLSTQGGFYPYTIIKEVVLPVAMPSAPDPTGPDQYGYYAYSSADNLWRQSPVFNWIDISAVGTEIPKPAGVNDFTVTVDLPFTFRYYGIDQNQVRISSDGWVAFGSGTQTSFLNKILPCNDTINNMVAVFWDDLFTNSATTGKLLYYYDAAQHIFIAEWNDVPHLASSDDKETFQIQLFDPSYYPTPTGDGEIILQYKSIVEPGSCTIGIEDQSEQRGLLYLFDEIYDVTANEIGDNFAVKFTTAAPVIVAVEDDKNLLASPTTYSLDQNYPNPFNPSTRISYAIPEAGNVDLKIYRIDGELIRTITEEYKPAGKYEVIWDGRNNSGEQVSSGVYFYKLHSNSFIQVKKMIFLK